MKNYIVERATQTWDYNPEKKLYKVTGKANKGMTFSGSPADAKHAGAQAADFIKMDSGHLIHTSEVKYVVVLGADGDETQTPASSIPKTLEQKRGDILHKKLDITNEFIEDEFASGMTFGDYLKSKDMDEKTFFESLPQALMVDQIFDAKANTKGFLDYHDAMAKYYASLHLAFIDKQDKHLAANAARHANSNGNESIDNDWDVKTPVKMSAEGNRIEDNEALIQMGYVNPDFTAMASGHPDVVPANLIPGNEFSAIPGDDFYKSADGDYYNSFGSWLKKNVAAIKDDAKKVFTFDKKILLTPVRGAFLAMLDANLFGLATSINHVKSDKNQAHWNKVLAAWKDKFQGQDAKLTNAVNKGGGKKQLFIGLLDTFEKKHHSADGYMNADAAAVGAIAVGATAAAGGAATAILALGTPETAPATAWVGAGSAALGAITPILKDFAKSKGADPAVTHPAATAVSVGTTPSIAKKAGSSVGLYIGIALGVVVVFGAIMAIVGGSEDK